MLWGKQKKCVWHIRMSAASEGSQCKFSDPLKCLVGCGKQLREARGQEGEKRVLRGGGWIELRSVNEISNDAKCIKK